MGNVLRRIKAGDRYILECTDIFIDFNTYISQAQAEGIKLENIKITLIDDPDIYLDVETIEKLKKQLEQLTSNVKDNDSEIEKFAKITTAIRKNIKYAVTKTKSRNIGLNGNFVEGLLKGKCVCSGYAIITKLALQMHGIDAATVDSDIHSWNKVNLQGKWYNWDMTNVSAQTLTALTMGKCLKSDQELEKQSIYRNNNSQIPCVDEPSPELVNSINNKIKENIKNVPVISKDTFMGKMIQKIKKFIKKINDRDFGRKIKMLPEVKETQIVNKEEQYDYSNFEPFLDLDDKDSIVWKIKAWNKGDVSNKIRTSYIELPKIGTPEYLSKRNKEEFDAIYKSLLGDQFDTRFIGKMELLKNEKGEEHWVGSIPSSDECKDVVEQIEKAIQIKEQREVEENKKMQENQKSDEIQRN